MKTFATICGIIGFLAWVLLCIGAAIGFVQVDVIDYCFATGLLSFYSLLTAIREF